jgi:hypothetical protein
MPATTATSTTSTTSPRVEGTLAALDPFLRFAVLGRSHPGGGRSDDRGGRSGSGIAADSEPENGLMHGIRSELLRCVQLVPVLAGHMINLLLSVLPTLHGARFPTEIYTRGCHWIPRMFA